MTTARRPRVTPVPAQPANVGVRLAPRPVAPRIARKLVRNVCAQAGLTDRVADNAALVAGELVTISVHQTRSVLDVFVTIDAGGVTVCVRDAGAMAPDDTVRGLTTRRSWALVRRLGRSSGHRATVRGREMWAWLPREPLPLLHGVEQRHRPVGPRSTRSVAHRSRPAAAPAG